MAQLGTSAKLKIGAYAALVLLAALLGLGFYASYNQVSRESAQSAEQSSTSTGNPSTTPANKSPQHSGHGKMIGYLAGMILSLIGLGIMVAYDVTQVVGSAAVDALMDDRGEGVRDPAYERAEQAWAAGKFLEAIQMMRDFLKDNPREQYAALRIAEIYEKDLKNLLAAALEYEEVLKKKLPAERWGWAAIHLCNLYAKLGQQDKTRALLQRIVDEYPKTGAAKKARAKLGLPEPEPDPVAPPPEPADGEEAVDGTVPDNQPMPDLASTIEELSQPEEAPPPPPPKSNLPPGFRPK
jgi:TolA-binding protein